MSKEDSYADKSIDYVNSRLAKSMQYNFWQILPKPIFALAPMANVTDAAFRRIIAKYSKIGGGYPYITYTEFVSADGLFLSDARGREALLRDLLFSGEERPIVGQFFSANTEMIARAARLARELFFDGFDINMGCPDRSVEKQGAGAALVKNPSRARELIYVAKKEAGDMPVSVKTRIGYSKDELDAWLPEILSEKPAAVILHLRTRKEMSDVPAHWERMARAVEIRDTYAPETFLIGNGDVSSLDDAMERCRETGTDGVMIGRGIFGNPWLFSGHIPSVKEKLSVMVEHTKLFGKLLGDIKNFSIMKKHYKAYVNGFHGAKELRMELMKTENADDVSRIVDGALTGF